MSHVYAMRFNRMPPLLCPINQFSHISFYIIYIIYHISDILQGGTCTVFSPFPPQSQKHEMWMPKQIKWCKPQNASSFFPAVSLSLLPSVWWMSNGQLTRRPNRFLLAACTSSGWGRATQGPRLVDFKDMTRTYAQPLRGREWQRDWIINYQNYI